MSEEKISRRDFLRRLVQAPTGPLFLGAAFGFAASNLLKEKLPNLNDVDVDKNNSRYNRAFTRAIQLVAVFTALSCNLLSKSNAPGRGVAFRGALPPSTDNG